MPTSLQNYELAKVRFYIITAYSMLWNICTGYANSREGERTILGGTKNRGGPQNILRTGYAKKIFVFVAGWGGT